MNDFALITEGPTDQAVIGNILRGYFQDNIYMTHLQPPDETDKHRAKYGGWELVLNYCETELANALSYNRYIIIHIDTDIQRIEKYKEGRELTPDEVIDNARLMLIAKIGDQFYNKYQDRIIFAIAVHSIECWILPIYCKARERGKIKGCLTRLDRCIKRKSPKLSTNKTANNYLQMTKVYGKRKTLMKMYLMNPSFKVFIEEIEKRNIEVEEEFDDYYL
jgi:hypothetical protein